MRTDAPIPRPFFLGIGAPKSGTSWVARCLAEHPELSIPVKESHFFSRDVEYEQGIACYARNWADLPPLVKGGEFSPNYLGTPTAAERIARHYPAARLIAVLRNPVSRAHAQHLHHVRAGEDALGSAYWDYADSHHCIRHGFYARNLTTYLRHFPREQLLVLLHEEVQRAPEAALRSIFEFLDVDPTFVARSLTERVNPTRLPKSRVAERALDLGSALAGVRILTPAKAALHRMNIPDYLRRLNSRKLGRHATPPSEAVGRLRGRYATDMQQLEEILRRPVRQLWGFG